MRNRIRRWAWMLLMTPMVASAAVRDLWAPDEPRYGEVAREIYEGGSFLVMHLCREVYPDKPPLLFWLSGLFGRLFDWSELSLRLPSLVATLLTAWLVQRLATRFSGEAAARWAPAFFLTFAMVTEIGGRLQIDPLLTFLCTLALDLLTTPADSDGRRALLVLAAGLAVGLGQLAKGPVALVNVGLPLLAWTFIGPRGSIPRAPRAAWIGAVVLSVVPVLLWAGLATLRRPELADELFFGQHAGRITRGDRHPGPVWKHLVRMPLLLLPWTSLVIAGIARGWRQLRQGLVGVAPLALGWLGSLLLFYSVIPPKRDLYLLPAYPAAALLAAAALAATRGAPRLSRWVTLPPPVVLMTVGTVVSLAWLATDELPGLSWRGPLAGVPAILGGVVAVVLLRRRGLTEWAKAVAATWALFATLVALLLFPALDPLKSARGVAEELAVLPQRPAAVPCFGVQPEGYRFYSRGRVPTVRGENLAAALERDGVELLALVRTDEWERLEPGLRDRLRVIARRQVGSKEMLVVGSDS